METLARGMSLAAALELTAADGAARHPGAVDPAFLASLRREIDAGPFAAMSGAYGKVRMEIDGYDVAAPMEGFPLLRGLTGDLGRAVREQGHGIRGLATWRPNETGIARYRPGSLGITPHMDGKWYRRLVAVVTVYGRARFVVTRTREGEIVHDWTTEPGDLVLLRGPGLGGVRDGRPFHAVEGPRRGLRCSIGIRMAVDPPP